MAFADPRWLEILKSSGGQSFAAAAACGLLLLVAHLGWLPPLDPWMVQAATFGAFLFGLLALVSFLSALNRSVGLYESIMYRIERRQKQKEVSEYIPHMTDHERRIIGHLLACNQKQFAGEVDGGHAATLIARKILVRPNAKFISTNNTTFQIPDEVWEVLVAQKDKFPIQKWQVPPWLRRP